MPEPQAKQVQTIPKRQELILKIPCFSQLNFDESEELALIMNETIFEAGETIVKEGQLVDSVYIIISGEAEVIHEETTQTKMTLQAKIKKIPIAILASGETIGLNDSGFYSQTGRRTATVTAISPMHVLKLDVKNLHYFFTAHPNLQTEMFAAAGKMLRMQLIKQSLPFSKLSHERLLWLADKVEEISIPAGHIIFREGEHGDKCYLIRSGQVEILEGEGENEHHIAVLKSPTLFGEATLINHSPRNATAMAIDDCKLLALRHEYLSELIETEDKVAKMFMTLMVDRSRPLQNPQVIVHERKTADKQHVIILKNPESGNYFKLSSEGWFIWQQLNGQQTMQEITLAFADKFNIFAPDVVAGLISKLALSGFILNVEIVNEDANQARWARALGGIRAILEKRITIGDADKWITKLYQKGGHYLFSSIGKYLLATFTITGVLCFGFSTPHITHVFQTIHHSWILLVLLIPFSILSVALHELGHALTTKAFGHEVHYMGVGWYWLGPVAFTDTSDMWLSTRWPRIMVNLAGIYSDCIFAGLASILILIIPNGYVQGFLWIFALYTYIHAFRMLSPLQELDGYYVLMDVLDRPRLRESAVLWLLHDFPKAIRHPRLFKQHFAEVCYWVAALIYLVLVTLIVLLVQSFVFKIAGLHSSNIFVSLALPFLIVIISSLTVIADIKGKVEK